MDLPAVVHSVYVTRGQQLTKDSLLRYTDGTPDKKTSPMRETLFYILMYPSWANFIRQGKLWGVGNAYSLMVWGSAPSQPAKPESPLSRLIGAVLTRLSGLSGLLDSPEQKKRRKEFADKVKSYAEESMGARVRDMLSVDALLTVREHRRKGYASSLVRTLTDQADKEGRAAWLVSSNIGDNTVFYESLGFKTSHYIVLGDNNPTWTEEPVKLAVMVREPVEHSKQ